MTGQSPEQRVDLDLDVLAPPPKSFRLRGKTYRMPAEVPLTAVLEAMRINNRILACNIKSKNLEERQRANDELNDALQEKYDLVVRIVQMEDAEVTELPASEDQVDRLFALILFGGDADSLEEAIKKVLEAGGAAVNTEGEVEGLPPTQQKTRAVVGKGGRGASRKRSPARSSA